MKTYKSLFSGFFVWGENMDKETEKKIDEISTDISNKLVGSSFDETGLFVGLVMGIGLIVIGLFGL